MDEQGISVKTTEGEVMYFRDATSVNTGEDGVRIHRGNDLLGFVSVKCLLGWRVGQWNPER